MIPGLELIFSVSKWGIIEISTGNVNRNDSYLNLTVLNNNVDKGSDPVVLKCVIDKLQCVVVSCTACFVISTAVTAKGP